MRDCWFTKNRRYLITPGIRFLPAVAIALCNQKDPKPRQQINTEGSPLGRRNQFGSATDTKNRSVKGARFEVHRDNEESADPFHYLGRG